jgi:hypothetical protein
MMYLLDVNALVAFGFQRHEFYRGGAVDARRTACAFGHLFDHGIGICESSYPDGRIRFGSRVCPYIAAYLKESSPLQFTFINDNHDVSQLPFWVKTSGQITDGHLAQLAKANGALLATLDRKIPGAFLIPDH